MIEHRQLEICCDSIESARTAADAGADRIELCVDLPADGLTPPTELLNGVKGSVSIPVFVLVRCRPGGFVFTDSELRAMLDEISALRDCGADGIVSGALRDDRCIDIAAAEQLIGAAGGLPFTFHKAFDACSDLERGMGVLVDLGVDRVLTSGGGRRALESMAELARLAELGGQTTRILCGGGIRSSNVTDLMGITGVREFHSAARVSPMVPVEALEVRALRAAIDYRC